MRKPSQSADSLKATLMGWLSTEYSELGSDALYLALSDVLTGGASSTGEPLARRFVAEARTLIEADYPDLPQAVVTATIGAVATDIELLRRNVRRVVRRSAESSLRQAPAGQAGQAAVSTYVREHDYAFIQVWSASTSRLNLLFDDEADLACFADRLTREQMFTASLEPPPAEYGAIQLELALSAAEPIIVSAGAASVGPGSRVVVATQHLPAELRKLAARRRARISAAHTAVNAPLPSGGGNPERRQVPGGHYSGVHAPGAPPPVADDFARVPTGGGESASVSAGGFDHAETTASRRRMQARARMEAAADTDARRVGRRRRTALRTDASTEVGGHDAEASSPGRAPTGQRRSSDSAAAFDDRRSSVRQTSSEPERSDAHPAPHDPARSPETAPTPAPPVGAPDAEIGARGLAPPDTLTTRQQRPVDGSAPAKAAATPEGLRGTGGWTRPITAIADGLQVGDPIGRYEGTEALGGSAALVLRAGARYPAALLDIETPRHIWSLAIREDTLLDIHTDPEDPQFSLHHAIEVSGLVGPPELAAALSESANTGEPLADILVRQRVLRFRQLDAITTARSNLMLKTLFEEPVAAWTLRGYETIRAPSVNAHLVAPLAWTCLLEERSNESQAALESLFERHHLDRPRFRSNAFLGPNALRLDARARRLIDEVFDGEVTVQQGLAQSPLRRRPTLALLSALDAADLLHWERLDTAESRIKRVWDAIEAKHRALGSANLFLLLDAHWSCDDVLVGEAFDATVRSLDLDFVQRRGTERETAVAAAVRRGLVDARAELADRARRAAIRSRFVDDFKRRSAIQLYEKQAELALFKEDFAAAADSLRRVVELDPKNELARKQLATVLGARAT